jgi:uncharacterized membrane protein
MAFPLARVQSVGAWSPPAPVGHVQAAPAPSNTTAAAGASPASFTSVKLALRVYNDGSARVTQVLSVNRNALSASVSLLTSTISDLVVLDQSGSSLAFTDAGQNLTIYTLGASNVTLEYDTQALTSKLGSVWTLTFVTEYNATVFLPYLSTLTSTSSAPVSFSDVGGSPAVVVGAGTWTMSYGVAFQPLSTTSQSATISTTSGSGTGSAGAPGGSGLDTPVIVLALVALAAAAPALAVFLLNRRRGTTGSTAQLRPDDVKVLDFIAEKGGRVLEPEVRMKFALPKTSAWRQIKRLERMGYVRITKIGSQNQVELVRERKDGSSS